MLKHILAIPFGIALTWVGIQHFTNPEPFVEIVPPLFPYALFWVYVTGVMEIVGGLALIHPKSRENAGKFVALFLVAVYPANLYMWTNDVAYNGHHLSTFGHIIRLLIQITLIAISMYLAGMILSKKESFEDE